MEDDAQVGVGRAAMGVAESRPIISDITDEQEMRGAAGSPERVETAHFGRVSRDRSDRQG